MLQILPYLFLLLANSTYYKALNGKVSFESKSNEENIRATSNELRGVIRSDNHTFNFVVALNSFHGFNSELQKNHYEENYVESETYPQASFTGKIVEEINYNVPGIYNVRAKGNFELHGVIINKIIPSKIIVLGNNQIKVTSEFYINLKEFNIKIPRLVHKKIAEALKINVELNMNK